MLGFFLYRETIARTIKLGYAVTLRIIDPIAEYCGFVLLFGGCHRLFENSRETCAVEYIVSKHQTHGIIADEILSDNESLRESIRRGLLGI